MQSNSIEILGIRIDSVTRQEAGERVQDFLASSTQSMIFTPNPEMLVVATKDGYFRSVLNRGALNVCDGMGIVVIVKLLKLLREKGKGIERIPGSDFMMDICEIAEKQGKSIFLLGSGRNEVAEKTKSELEKMFPKLRIVGGHPGLKIRIKNKKLKIKGDYKDNFNNSSIEYNQEENEKILEQIKYSKADILFVAFGHVKQECWIAENLSKLPNVKIAMGVGGAFDYIGGEVTRAPMFMRNLGLEWLWRLFRQPWRVARIWNATVRFVWLCVLNKKCKQKTPLT